MPGQLPLAALQAGPEPPAYRAEGADRYWAAPTPAEEDAGPDGRPDKSGLADLLADMNRQKQIQVLNKQTRHSALRHGTAFPSLPEPPHPIGNITPRFR